MFGENLIIGHSEGKISDKHRIFMPAFSNPQKGDKVIFAKLVYNEEQALKLFGYKSYLQIIERLQYLRDNASSLEEYNKYTEEIEKSCYSLECIAQIDAQRRLSLPKCIQELYGWKVGDPLIYDGMGECLLIRKQNK